MTKEEKNDVVRSLVTSLDRHSPGERAHAERVAVYAVATGNAMGLKGSELLTLRYAATLHDLGKVRVDARLLSKVGHLEEMEIAALRLHAELALSVLEEYSFLRAALPMIRHHHERWDGRGYPDGLAGNEIPLGARLIALAEAFDTLTIAPAWARQMPEQEALAELKASTGSQFDPSVYEAFVKVQPLIQPVGL